MHELFINATESCIHGAVFVLHGAAYLLDLLWRQCKGETCLLKSLAVV